MRGWLPNPYSAYMTDRDREEDDKPDPPAKTPLESLARQRWLPEEEYEWHYTSELLGKLEKDGFLFRYSGAWGDWPPAYLASVLAYARARLHVIGEYAAEYRRYERAKKGRHGWHGLGRSAPPADVVEQADRVGRAMAADFAEFASFQE